MSKLTDSKETNCQNHSKELTETIMIITNILKLSLRVNNHIF